MKKWLALSVVVCSFAVETFANNVFIPNHYRNRRTINNFAALGWSDRNEVQGSFVSGSSDTKVGSDKTDETDTTIFSGHYFRRLENLNFEAVLDFGTDNEKDLDSSTKYEFKYDTIQLGTGYQVNQMAFGLNLAKYHSHYKNKGTGNKTSSDLNLFRVGWGYRLEDNWFIGLGYSNIYTDSGFSGKDTDHHYILGGGRIVGDLTKPDAGFEGSLNYYREEFVSNHTLNFKGFINQDSIQYYGSLSHITEDEEDDDSRSFVLIAGLDYHINEFYIGPQLTYINEEAEGDVDPDITSTIPSVEMGYRKDQIEAFLRFDLVDRKDSYSNPADDDEKFSSSEIALGFAYFFK